MKNGATTPVGARGPERNAPEASVGFPLRHEDKSLPPTEEAGGIIPALSTEKSAPYDSNPAFGGSPGPGSPCPLRPNFLQRAKMIQSPKLSAISCELKVIYYRSRPENPHRPLGAG